MLPPTQNPQPFPSPQTQDDATPPPIAVPLPNPPPKHRLPLLLLGIFGAVLIISISAFYLFSKARSNYAQTHTSSPTPSLQPSEALAEETSTANWLTYTNTMHGFSFKHPSHLAPSWGKEALNGNEDEVEKNPTTTNNIWILKDNNPILRIVITSDPGRNLEWYLEHGISMDETIQYTLSEVLGIPALYSTSQGNEYYLLIHNEKLFNIYLSYQDNALANQILSTLTLTNTGLATYTHPTLGLSFQHDPLIPVVDSTAPSTSASYLRIFTKDLSNYQDEPNGYDLETALLDKKALDNNSLSNVTIDWPATPSTLTHLNNNTYAQEFMVLSRLDVCDVTLERRLIFYYKNHQIILVYQGDPQWLSQDNTYLITDPNNCGDSKVWDFENNTAQTFISDLKNNQASPAIQSWYNQLTQILTTVTFSN